MMGMYIDDEIFLATEFELREYADTLGAGDGFVTQKQIDGGMKLFHTNNIIDNLHYVNSVETVDIEYKRENGTYVTIQDALFKQLNILNSYKNCSAAYVEFSAKAIHWTVPKDSSRYSSLF